jgi:hypothetical protein
MAAVAAIHNSQQSHIEPIAMVVVLGLGGG